MFSHIMTNLPPGVRLGQTSACLDAFDAVELGERGCVYC